MTYKATLKVKFDTEFVNQSSYGVYDDETLPEEHYTFEVPAHDLNTIQLFRFFGTVARTMGHNDVGIMKGAASLAFNDMRNEEDMKRVADEFDLKMAEDYAKELRKMQDEIYDLKAKLSRLEQPDNPQYTDEEMDALCSSAEKAELRKKLVDADVVCFDCGKKYGEYHDGVSSVYEGKCNVCGEIKSITETRDFKWLQKGIKELS
jgi:hypothetical protein